MQEGKRAMLESHTCSKVALPAGETDDEPGSAPLPLPPATAIEVRGPRRGELLIGREHRGAELPRA